MLAVGFQSIFSDSEVYLTLFRMGLFETAHEWGGGGQTDTPLLKICHTYPTMMKLGSYTLPKADPKNI